MPTSRRWQRKLKKLMQIKAAFPEFNWTVTRDRHVHIFQFTGYPTVNGQRPSLDALLAHITGATTLRFDNPEHRASRGIYTRYPIESRRPYAIAD